MTCWRISEVVSGGNVDRGRPYRWREKIDPGGGGLVTHLWWVGVDGESEWRRKLTHR